MSTYITVAIPYVNAHPHLGYAFELVEADLAARARRRLGEPVRFLGGTDDHSLKNVLAAAAAGVPTQAFVDAHAQRFVGLANSLRLSFDDYIRTSRDPRHRPAVERLWRACAASGDLYRREYEGSYCVGCERFYDRTELIGGRCAEHDAPVETVVETNWFFRLSRYERQLIELIESDRLLVDPSSFRSEVLAFVRSGLRDISVSRSVERARGWGIGVPDDPSQVVYVWYDALTNYISALDYGTDGDRYHRWWRDTDDRVHVVGKGILRFHAVYWPAFLLSAGEPLPTRIHVHPYLTLDGAKLSKSAGGGAAPDTVIGRIGADALRWWFARDVGVASDTDVTVERIAERANDDLANGIGNAVNRVSALVHRYRAGEVPHTGEAPLPGARGLAVRVDRALADFDRRAASASIVAAVDELNAHIEATAPWRLAKQVDAAETLDRVLDRCVATLLVVADAIAPIAPQLAGAISAQLDRATTLPRPEPVFPRLEVP